MFSHELTKKITKEIFDENVKVKKKKTNDFNQKFLLESYISNYNC